MVIGVQSEICSVFRIWPVGIDSCQGVLLKKDLACGISQQLDLAWQSLKRARPTSVWDIAEADRVIEVDGIVDMRFDVHVLSTTGVPSRKDGQGFVTLADDLNSVCVLVVLTYSGQDHACQ